MTPTTQELGALAELRFQTRCLERGIACFAPIIGANPAIDFVIRQDDTFVSVQVKKARIDDQGGKINPRIVAGTCDKRYKRYRERNAPTCDYFAFVCFELNSVWLIPSSEIVTIHWSKALARAAELNDYLF